MAGLEQEHSRLETSAEEADAAAEKSSADIAPVHQQVYDLSDAWGKTRDAAAAAHKAAAETAKVLAISQQELAGKTELNKLVSDAAQKAQQVVALAADAEIANAASILQKRSQTLAEQVATLSKKVDEQTAADKTAQANFAAAKAAAAPVAEKFQSAHKQVAAAAPAWQAVEGKRVQTHEAVAANNKRLDQLKALADVAQSQRAVVEAQAAVEKARAAHTATLPAITQANEKLAACAIDPGSAGKSARRSSCPAGRGAKKLDEKQQILTAVADAQAKVQFAGQKLVEDQVLREVADKLKSRADELTKGLVPFRNAVADEDAKARAAAESEAGMKQQQAAAENALAQATAQAQQLESAAKTAAATVDSDLQKVRSLQQELGKHQGRNVAARAP